MIAVLVAALAAAGSTPVVDGAPETGAPAVVALVTADGHASCSGFAIGARTIMTAAHCVASAAPAAVFLGADPAGPGRTVAVVEVARHPGYTPGAFAHDLAVITVAEDLGVAPLRWLDGAIDPAAPTRVVGFGHGAASGDDAHVKRTGAVAIAAVRALELELSAGPALPCVGDSGGPVLQRAAGGERVIGVISHGDAFCAYRATAVRLDDDGGALIDDALASDPASEIDAGGCAASSRPGHAVWLVLAVLGALLRRARTSKESS